AKMVLEITSNTIFVYSLNPCLMGTDFSLQTLTFCRLKFVPTRHEMANTPKIDRLTLFRLRGKKELTKLVFSKKRQGYKVKKWRSEMEKRWSKGMERVIALLLTLAMLLSLAPPRGGPG
ncbi:MAG: hypothetical protein Q4C55_07440, partial [Eubacterium sp.]|nr:hypothetical protein [Eubacterium sp.]